MEAPVTPKAVSLLLNVTVPGAVTVAIAPESILPPRLSFTTVLAAKVVTSVVPGVDWFVASQVTAVVLTPAQAAWALR